MEKTCYYIFAYTVLLLAFQMPCLAKTFSSLATDQFALSALKAHITLDPYSILRRNWTNSSSVCNWIGVTCGLHHHRVTALNISNMSLSGTIPPQLGNLSFLVLLTLKYNFFSGILPQELSLLHRVKYISLAHNNFMGEIPSWFGLLPKLEQLFLYENSFTGFIPTSPSNLSNLQKIDFSNNSIHGNIPQELGRLHNLQVLSMQGNQLSGVIPSSIFNMSSLKIIAFTENELSGSLPIDMCRDLPFLEGLYLSHNQLSGGIPSSISNCSRLEVLALFYDSLIGQIPEGIGKLKSLQSLFLSGNNLNGVLPREIGQLDQLKDLRLAANNFSGSIPPEIFNISTLGQLILGDNALSGALPTNMCNGLSVLTGLFLYQNYLSGAIPDSISNCSKLIKLELSFNKFTGFIPHTLGYLRFLEYLGLSGNNLRSESSSSELGLFTSLTNCKSLNFLTISYNPLDVTIPASMGNLSTSLQYFYADNCKIKGSIPVDIGNLSNLVILSLSNNELSGNIPLTFKHFHELQELDLQNNNLGVSIPEGLCDLHSLGGLYLRQNQFSGPIPECLGNITSLRELGLDSNRLTSSIPSSLWHLKDLSKLDLSSNFLSGFLPSEIGNLVAVIYVNLSLNQLIESIPDTIGNLQNLVNLSLAHNRLEGSIPVSVGGMTSLETLDLSYNNLSGSVPRSMEALQYLHYFNVSFNSLSGEIPTGGPFKNFTVESFKANKALCGIPRFRVPPCHALSNHRSKRKKVEFALFILAGVVLITIISLTFIFVRYRRKDKTTGGIDELVSTIPERISYYEILRATEQFNESNLLGIGSFGSVYRGILIDGKVIAVKVFNKQSITAFRSFDVECEVLRNIRHRNLTKVISSCSNEDFKALVLEYMPKGNLEKWLYSHNYCLDVMQRLNIMIDVASALEYLHHGYSASIVHCDLKPSNVLLDEDMIAHVSDFGIAKLLADGESIVLTNTLATLGYIAPEYGLEGQVSTRCDVYSYGMLLMETFTRKRPSDDMFAGDLSLKNWVENLLPQSPHHVIDANLLKPDDQHFFDKMLQCISSVLELALKCSAESPRDRINMKEALAELKKIKLRFST